MFTAIIDEDKCVGCSRCLPACPVDAIVGTLHHTHTVLLDECIGCKLCVNPCPVDCITIEPLETHLATNESINKIERANKAKKRHQQQLKRKAEEAQKLLPNFASASQKQAAIRENIQAALTKHRQKQIMEKTLTHALD